MTKPLKVLFFGTADFSASFLTPIIESQHKVVGVVTGLDKVTGRGKKVQFPKVKEVACQHNIPVWQFSSSLRHPENYQQLLDEVDFDICVVVAFGDILPVELIHSPKYQSINVHPSLLPFGRGASPVQNTVAKGDDKTAFCIIKMDATLDTGDILLWQDVEVDPRETSDSLFAKLSLLGGPLLIKVLDDIENYIANAQPQAPLDVPEPKKTYTRKIKKSYGKFKSSLEAIVIDRKLRAYTPWPGLFFTNEGQDIKVTETFPYENFLDFVKGCAENREHLTFMDHFFPSEVAEEILADQRNLLPFAEQNPNYLAEKFPLGTVIATSKKNIFVLCNKGTVLAIAEIHLPGKKPAKVATLKNGYPNLLKLGTLME